MPAAWTDGIKPALAENGYEPIRVNELQHNEQIGDRIIAELRLASLLVADFTQQKGGVYFECGYAMGRGIPVVWCCREDDIKNAHFDTRQYNHITWSTPAELHERLRDRIRATLPVRVPSTHNT
jgi:nucleoside 2-deoxyribosyltransferase